MFKVGDVVREKGGPFWLDDTGVITSDNGSDYSVTATLATGWEYTFFIEEKDLELAGTDETTITAGKGPPAGGVKHDSGKPDPTFLSWELVQGVAKVREFGAKKYSRNNWKKGLGVERNIAAAIRHLYQALNESNLDPESGLPHFMHAVCSIEQAYYDSIHHPELDGRPEEVKCASSES